VRAKGVSPIVATALLILIAIALGVGMWLFASRLIGSGEVGTAHAYLASSRFVGGQHVAVVNLDIKNLADSRLQVQEIRVQALIGASAATATITSGSGSLSGGGTTYSITVNPTVGGYIEPRGSASFVFTFTRSSTGSVLSEVSFVITLRSDSGATYTVASNSVMIS